MSQNSDVTLECRNLWKVFGEGTESTLNTGTLPQGKEAIAFADELRSNGGIVASGDINLKIKRGEFFVLMGLSGSGKSTLDALYVKINRTECR